MARKFIPSAAFALLAFAAAPAEAASTQVGVNAAIRNSVQMKTDNDASLRPAVLREPVHIGDAVASGPQSALQVLLLDRSVFSIGANARVTIDKFVYDPNRGTSDIAASVTRGAFRFMSGRLQAGAGSGAIKTPVATIGVRGTIVEGLVGPDIAQVLAGEPGLPALSGNLDAATLVLLEGPGAGNQGFDKPGAIDVTVGAITIPVEHAGSAILILGPGQPPIGPFQLSDTAFARLALLLNGAPGPNEGNNLTPPPDAFGGAGPGLDNNSGIPANIDLPLGDGGQRQGGGGKGGGGGGGVVAGGGGQLP